MGLFVMSSNLVEQCSTDFNDILCENFEGPVAGSIDEDLDGIAKKMQARINRMTEGCRGVVTLSGESDRTGKVLGLLCDSPVYDPEPGETTSNEFVSIIREDSQKTKEYGESGDHSGEQDS